MPRSSRLPSPLGLLALGAAFLACVSPARTRPGPAAATAQRPAGVLDTLAVLRAAADWIVAAEADRVIAVVQASLRPGATHSSQAVILGAAFPPLRVAGAGSVSPAIDRAIRAVLQPLAEPGADAPTLFVVLFAASPDTARVEEYRSYCHAPNWWGQRQTLRLQRHGTRWQVVEASGHASFHGRTSACGAG